MKKSLHFGVCKLARYVRNCVVFWKNLHSWHKFYTTAGRYGRDKCQPRREEKHYHADMRSLNENGHLYGTKIGMSVNEVEKGGVSVLAANV